MQSRPSISTPRWRGQEFGHHRILQSRSRLQQVLVSPLPNPTMVLRREILVSNLFKHMKEIQSIDDGYAFQFHRSDDLEDLIEQIAEYILFESHNSPQLTFAIVVESHAKAFWLQVRSLETEKSDVTAAYISTLTP